MQVIILTGFGSLDAARLAIRHDVVDFLTKPCKLEDLDVVLALASPAANGKIVAAAHHPAASFRTSTNQ